jgi:hypothetical protein
MVEPFTGFEAPLHAKVIKQQSRPPKYFCARLKYGPVDWNQGSWRGKQLPLFATDPFPQNIEDHEM